MKKILLTTFVLLSFGAAHAANDFGAAKVTFDFRRPSISQQEYDKLSAEKGGKEFLNKMGYKQSPVTQDELKQYIAAKKKISTRESARLKEELKATKDKEKKAAIEAELKKHKLPSDSEMAKQYGDKNYKSSVEKKSCKVISADYVTLEGEIPNAVTDQVDITIDCNLMQNAASFETSDGSRRFFTKFPFNLKVLDDKNAEILKNYETLNSLVYPDKTVIRLIPAN